MRCLENLNPADVFGYFEDICSIPHGSGNTKAVSDYCVDFAKKHGLSHVQDYLGNIVIKKPASNGYEEHSPVILQGHLDMVCEKDADCDIDMETEGLSLFTDGDLLGAHGTTLGGDDGIAVAMVLAVLADNTLPHPPIEAVFTVDEETGMYGAEGINPALISGRTLINIDSEDEGVLTAGCAGGARAELSLPFQKKSACEEYYTVKVSGLRGGHSGVEIDKGRYNANCLLANFLLTLPSFRLADIHGGLKDNAIPALSECTVCCDADIKAAADEFVKANYRETDPDFKITVTPAEKISLAADSDESLSAARFLAELPNGIQAMSEDIDGLVETSLNLGILKTENGKINASFAVRSSKNAKKAELLEKLEVLANKYGAQYSSHGHYPAWEYRKSSPLRDTMINAYEKLYGTRPTVAVIHAGLECGLFSEKLENLDAVSFGPNMLDIHTPRERLSVSSTQRTYRYLCEILKML